jgi:hypothetical protein
VFLEPRLYIESINSRKGLQIDDFRLKIGQPQGYGGLIRSNEFGFHNPAIRIRPNAGRERTIEENQKGKNAGDANYFHTDDKRIGLSFFAS